MVLTRLDGDDVPKKKRSAKPASGRQEHAFMALQNLIIDRGEKVVPSGRLGTRLTSENRPI